MASKFALQIVTFDGLLFEGQVEGLYLRTSEGDVGILKGHIDYLAAIETGVLKIIVDGKPRLAAISGGFVSVAKDITRVVAVSCEWAEQIDRDRALQAKERADKQLKQSQGSDQVELAKLKLARALNRLNVSAK